MIALSHLLVVGGRRTPANRHIQLSHIEFYPPVLMTLRVLRTTAFDRDQRPMNFGGRLAWNASTPSLKSSDWRSRL